MKLVTISTYTITISKSVKESNSFNDQKSIFCQKTFTCSNSAKQTLAKDILWLNYTDVIITFRHDITLHLGDFNVYSVCLTYGVHRRTDLKHSTDRTLELTISWEFSESYKLIILQKHLWMVILTHLLPMHPFSTPRKNQKNLTVFWCFQGGRERCIGNKWVKVPGDISLSKV